VTRRIALLLPPSEGKASGGTRRPFTVGTLGLPELDLARVEVLASLGALDPLAPIGPTMPAIDRYTGVLYRELGYRTLATAERRRFDRDALIVSGLWGAVRPRDLIPAYRLKMGASLPPLGKLSTWWRPRLTAALAGRLRGCVVWDLLPNEHAVAWRPDEVAMARRITVRFVDADDRTVSHWNKLLKGALVRHLLSHPTTDPTDLAGFRHRSGYRFDPDASDLVGDPAVVVLRHCD
jgi:cytoplasmic iron level regulating protein YaaA (DUF328/UPF0246 family)